MLESIFGEFQDGVDRLYDLGGELHFPLHSQLRFSS